MRFSLTALVLVPITLLAASVANAQEGSSLAARIEARRELERAKNNLRYYWQVDLPRQRRDLNGAIELTEMELKNLNTQLREFRPFTQFSIGEPFPLTVRCLQMRIKETELRLENLRSDRNAMTRFRSDDFDMRASDVREARASVLALEPQAAEEADAAEALPAVQQ